MDGVTVDVGDGGYLQWRMAWLKAEYVQWFSDGQRKIATRMLITCTIRG